MKNIRVQLNGAINISPLQVGIRDELFKNIKRRPWVRAGSIRDRVLNVVRFNVRNNIKTTIEERTK